MKIFTIDDKGNPLFEEEELRVIPEFKALFKHTYNRRTGDVDGRKGHRAKQELTYMYFMYSYHSVFTEMSEEERHPEALSAAEFKPNYKISPVLETACEKYKKLQETRAIKLLKAAQSSVDKLKDYFENATLVPGEDTSKPVVKANDLIKNINSLGDTIDSLNKLERAIKKEKESKNKTRGDQEEGWLN